MLVFDINISHGNVATCLRSGGMFYNDFIANLPPSLSVKEFWKSVNISRSYRQKYSDVFWLTVYFCDRYISVNKNYHNKGHWLDAVQKPSFSAIQQTNVMNSQ